MTPLARLSVAFEGLRNVIRPQPFTLLWPTEYPVITQPFGGNPAYYSRFGMPGHEGIDFKALHGSFIFACAAGKVYRVEGQPDSNNYGIHVRIQHRDGFATIYAHLMMPTVALGDTVVAGQLIGLADNTGNSFGDHLHLTARAAFSGRRPARRAGGQSRHWT